MNFFLKFAEFQQFENSIVELQYQDFTEDSVIRIKKVTKVLNGKFEFEGELLNPAASASLLFLSSKSQFLFVIDTGIMNIQRNLTTKLNRLKTDNSKTNTLFNKLLKLSSIEILNGVPINGQTLQDIRLKELALLTKDSCNFYGLIGLYKLWGLVFSVPKDSIEKALLGFRLKMGNYPLYKNIEKGIQFQNSTKIGKVIPDFSFLNVDGKTFTTYDLEDKPYLIAFGATWCGPCKKQIPKLKELLKKYPESKLGRLYINMDKDSIKWHEMIERYQLHEFINLTDIETTNASRMVRLLDILAFPTYLIISGDRKIYYNSNELQDFDLNLAAPILNRLCKIE